jgi:hypothetical protein
MHSGYPTPTAFRDDAELLGFSTNRWWRPPRTHPALPMPIGRAGTGNNITFYIEVQVRKEREALLVLLLAKRADISDSRSVICLRSSSSTRPRPRSQTPTIGPPSIPRSTQRLSTPPRGIVSLARAVSRRPPHRCPPCVFCLPTLFSACSQHTGSPACVWCVCRPLALFSAIAIAHSISSIIGRLSVFTCFPCVPFTDAFQRLLPVPGGVPSGLVQRTGCSACGLGYPHQTPVLVGSPHVHSSCLGPVSFAGFLIKCTPRWASTAISAAE